MEELTKIMSPAIYPIKAPVAGNYPQGLFKYPFRAGLAAREDFTQTLVWSPKIDKTFAVDTEYTATITLNPKDTEKNTFKGTLQSEIGGLPAKGVKNISTEIKGESLVINIVFEKTAGQNAPAQILFEDDFDGTSIDMSKWDICDDENRQGRSKWMKDMVAVGGGNLHLKLRRDDSLGPSWIRSGAVQTRKRQRHDQAGGNLFDNGYGYYEARIKFPLVSGTWGAFWMFGPTVGIVGDEGVDGTEIDIVESIRNQEGKFNSALHWDGYGKDHKFTSQIRTSPNVYDGQFHTFALDWSPSEYIFYVDGEAFWRVSEKEQYDVRLSDYNTVVKGNPGIAQNPNHIILSVEGSEWAGPLPANFTEDEMLIDWVKVWNQPQRISL